MLETEYTGCGGDTITLDATCTNALSFQWFKDSVLIANETSATLDVTQEGMYVVEVTTNSGVESSGTNVMIDTDTVAFDPDDLYYCDEDDDGFGTFDLNEADNEIIGGNPSGNLEVSYHLTLTDAENDVMQLQSPYENIVPDFQILYARLNNTFTGCFEITELRINVFEFQPVNTNPDDLVYVEPNSDGIGIFNLTDIEPEVLSGIKGKGQ